MFSIENVGFAILVSSIISFVLYYVTALKRIDYWGLANNIGHGVLFLLLSYQTNLWEFGMTRQP